MFALLVFLLLLAGGVASAAPLSAAELARSLREASLDPGECYRVRDLTLQKEDIRVYFGDGYLIFSKPVSGAPRSAVFSADVEGGDGEVILLPPYRGERQSLASFTQSANLDEHFNAGLLLFTDTSGGELHDRILREGSGRKVPEMGALLAEKWNPVLANVESGFEIRTVTDVLNAASHGGMVFLALSGRHSGNFDVVYDSNAREQVMAGQLAERAGSPVYNIWTSFPARSIRSGSAKPPAPWYTLSNFRIDAALDADLRMKATTRLTLELGAEALRVFPFSISRAMHVTAARVDGAPAELFSRDSLRGRALRGLDDDLFLVVPAGSLQARSRHEFEFDHEGAVIASAGNGVYYVGARATWYPHSGNSFATYDLQFHYPRRLTLVTAGDVVEDRADADWRTTRWRTPVPIRAAGFNLGEYEKVSGSVPGYTVEVYGNRHLASALQPRPRDVLGPPLPTRTQRDVRVAPSPPVQAIPVIPDPLARLRTVAADVSSALEFYAGKFGPLALKTLTVAPIPGTFGQGFPGLVYLSTFSYLDPAEFPAQMSERQRRFFFADLIGAHEVAHQWWGNVVTSGAYQDDWLLEALANYSALLWIEKKKGTRALETALDDFREHLTSKDNQGRSVESAGPVIWGARLESSGVADAWRALTYEKGAWILHMLRRRMGDERFFGMLAELRRRYEFQSVTTDDFRALAKEFRPTRMSATMVDEFFDNWVYATGIPSLKLQYTVKGTAPAVRLGGTLTQSGVDEDFSAEVPIEIQFAKGASQTVWVHTSSEPAPFSVTLRQAPIRVAVATGSVLALKK